MRREKQSEHLSDEQLLAYLDGEMTYVEMRATRSHLRRCWKCRASQSTLETQIEFISRLFSECSDIDLNRSIQAKEQFLAWRKSIEERHGSSSCSWPPHLQTAIRLPNIVRRVTEMLPSLSPS